MEAYELCDPIDGESEKEAEKSEKDADDKIRSNSQVKNVFASNNLNQTYTKQYFQSLHYSRILTPPPELLSLRFF